MNQTSSVLIVLSLIAIAIATSFNLRQRWRNQNYQIQESLSDVYKSCKIGAVYTVNSGEDLFKYKDEYDCVYSSALVPNKVPEGNWYGRPLIIARLKPLNQLITEFWRGKHVHPIQCSQGEKTYIVWNNVRGLPVLPSIARVGQIKETFANGEYDDGRGAVQLGYTKDYLNQGCPEYEKYLVNGNNSDNSVIGWKTLINPPVVDQAIDILRFVGRQPDGGGVYLGKTMVRDYYGSENRFIINVGFWYMINYDKNVLPEFKATQSLPPLAQSYIYKSNGVVTSLNQVLPFDDLVTHPRFALPKIHQELSDLGNSIRVNWRGLAQGTWTINYAENQQQFNNYFSNFNTDRYHAGQTKFNPNT